MNQTGENQIRYFVAGIISAGVTTVVTNPLELAKTRLQSGIKNANFWSVLKDVGIKRSFVCGLRPNLIGVVPHSGVFFVGYKNLMERLEGQLSLSQNLASGISAFSAGAFANLACNSFWVVKTRMSTDPERYSTMRTSFRLLRRESGYRFMFKGAVPSMLGALHVSVMFPVYETLKKCQKDPNSPIAVMTAGCASKVVASTLTYPLEVIRTLQQQENTHRAQQGIRTTLMNLWRTERLRGLYRGQLISLFKNVPSQGITMLLYEPIVNDDSWVQKILDFAWTTVSENHLMNSSLSLQ